jgi:hypothetical protein
MPIFIGPGAPNGHYCEQSCVPHARGDAIGIRELPVPSAIRRFMQIDVFRILKKREAEALGR